MAHSWQEVASVVREAAQHFPVMIGEWCLDTASPTPPPRTARSGAWQPTVAWTYWAYKHLGDTPASDIWDLGKAVELGFLPTDIRILG